MPGSPLDFTALGRQQEGLRRMVWALVGDEHGAEDVVQDAWVRALERGPAEPRDLGAWLGRVSRRLASNARRSQRRRRDREQLAARPEALPSSDEIAERVELEGRVLQVLAALPEPHRSVLRDRYLGDLTPLELARRDGLSRNTVKSRLIRAKAAMRAALEGEDFGQDGAGQQRSWSLALLPLYGPAAPALGLGASLTTTAAPLSLGGILAMKKLALLAIVLLLGSLSWKVLLPLEPPPADPAGSAVAQPAELAQAPPPVGELLESPIAKARASRDSASPVLGSDWGVAGRVQELGDGSGVAGIELEITLHRGFRVEGEVLQRMHAVSGRDGRFAVACAGPGESVTVALRAKPSPEHHVLAMAPVACPAGAEPPEDLLVTLLAMDAELHGLVQDSSGEPVPGASVWGSYGEAKCGPDGRYVLRCASKGRGVFRAVAAGFGTAELSLEGVDGQGPMALDFTLCPELVVRGTLTDPAGLAVANARVEHFGSSRTQATSDANGEYLLHGVAQEDGALVVLVATRSGFVPQSAAAYQGAGESLVIDFTLAAGVSVRGRLVDPSGEPVVGAGVWILPRSGSIERVSGLTDDQGEFVLEGVRPGQQQLHARHPGFAPLEESVEVAEDGLGGLLCRLQAGRVLRGVVRAEEGPVEGVRVSARQGFGYVGTSGTSDAQGQFVLEDLPLGALQLEATREGWAQAKASAGPQDSQVELAMVRSGQLWGRVVDQATGEPIPRFTVRLVGLPAGFEGRSIGGLDASWYRPGRTFSSADGRWSSRPEDHLELGTWAGVWVQAEGYAPLLLPAAQVGEWAGVGGEARPKDPAAAPGCLHALVAPVDVDLLLVTQGEQRPMAEVLVTAAGSEGELIDAQTSTGRTNPDGRLLLQGMAPGPLYLLVKREGGAEQQLGPLQVPAGAPRANLVVEIDPGAALQVDLLDRGGNPIAGAMIQLLAVGDAGSTGPIIGLGTDLRRRSDAEGRAIFQEVPAGEWQVAHVVRGGDQWRSILGGRVRIEPQASQVKYQLQIPGQGVIRGSFTGEAKVPDGAAVSVQPEGPGLSHGALVTNGEFQVTGVPPGNYVVSIVFDEDELAGRLLLAATRVSLTSQSPTQTITLTPKPLSHH